MKMVKFSNNKIILTHILYFFFISEGREVLSFNPKDLDDNSNNKYPSVRELFGKDEAVYVMDAKNIGNIGRFLNVCTTIDSYLIINSFTLIL